MLKLLVYFCLIISNVSHAGLPDLKTGDIVLVSLPCYSCRLIELETDSPYSHGGLIVVEGKGRNKKIFVYESLGSVKKTPIEEFLARKTKDSKAGFFRFHSIDIKSTEHLKNHFEKYYEGLGFDSDYLWNNTDQNGEQLYYCSEFISKFLHDLTGIEYFPPKPMTYSRYENYWRNVFRAPPPEGELGNSPGDLAKSPHVFEL